jgi:hypothetical protein
MNHAVSRHGTPGWRQRAGAGARHRLVAAWGPGVTREERCPPVCTPDTRRRADSSEEARSWPPVPHAEHGGGIEVGLRIDRQCRLRQALRYQRHRHGGVVSVGRRHELQRISASVESSAGDDNGRRGRAAVMRYGYRRGECFEGYEPRCGERHRVARPLGAWLSGHEASERGQAPGNAANPVRIGLQYRPSPRAEQAVEVVGIHEDGTHVQRVEPAHRREAATPTGSGRTGWNRRQGSTRAKPRRGGPGDWSRWRAGALKVTPSSRRARLVFHL